MAKRDYHKSKVGAHALQPETLMLNFGFDPALSEGAVKTPIFLTSTFVYRTCEEGERLFDHIAGRRPLPKGAEEGLIYTRFNNPNLQIVEERLAVLEKGEACAVFSSGMAAILTTVLAISSPGEAVLRSDQLYGGAETLFDTLLAKWGLRSARFEDGVDPESVRVGAKAAEALGEVAAIYVETPSNPTNSVVDLDLVARIAGEIEGRQGRRPLLICDNTLLGPLHQSPLAHGADLVVYSLTKYVGGHSDLIAGAAIGRAEPMAKVRSLRNLIGNQLDVNSCWMLTRSLETLRLRIDRAFASAREVANWLSRRPEVEKVAWLGAIDPDSPEGEASARQSDGTGATFSFVVKGGRSAAFKVLDTLEVIKLAVSLGGTESLACHPGTTTHSGVPAKTRQRLGIEEGMIRISIGLEAASDLIADLERGLDALSS